MIEIGGYQRVCKTTKGGIKRIYLFPFVPYLPYEVLSDGMNLIDFPQTNIFLYECEGNYTQSSEVENGAFFFSQNAQAILPKVYNLIDITTFLKQEFSVIITTNNGDDLLFGARNGLDVSMSNNSGSEKSEFNGFTLDFRGKEEATGLRVANLDDFFTIKTSNLLDVALNFNL